MSEFNFKLIIYCFSNCFFIFKVIIFDGTQSMEPDLVQLRLAIKKIVNEFSILPKNPIYNYILVVFRDPGKN